ncbi:MAG: integrase [Bacteroidetes bacterium]|nr:MAG: integrase [Bacteroidota bacterium]
MEAKSVERNGKKWILLRFVKDGKISGALKKIPRCHWDAQADGWMVPDLPKNQKTLRDLFSLPPKPLSEISKEVKEFQEYLQAQRYSENSISSYVDGLRIFLNATKDKKPKDLTDHDVSEFFRKYAYEKKKSISWQRLVMSAVKLYFIRIADRKINLEKIIRPRQDRKLPNVISKEEVQQLLKGISNLKHKTILSLIYCCGLRRGEALNLLPEHIDSKRGILHIKNAKGRKDRIAPLPESMVLMLREYFLKYRPLVYLFEGRNRGEPYSEKSLSEVLKQNLAKSGIRRPVTLHWLRHSYATHLLENGTDIRYIQELLGHNSPNTTQIYTHVSTKKISEIRRNFEDIDIG